MEILNLKTLYNEINTKIKTEPISTFKLKCCTDLLNMYSGNDWKEYVKFCSEKYIRVILSELSSDVFEIVLICWNKNQESPIHDHPNNGCLLKVLQGSLLENIYTNYNTEYVYVTSRINNVGDVSYMEKNDILHRIINNNNNEMEYYQSVSLHIYSPPKFKHNIFDDKNILLCIDK